MIYDTLFNPLSDTLIEFLNGGSMDRITTGVKTGVQEIAARQEIECFTHFKKTYISSAKDANLPEAVILDFFTLLPWYKHKFWKSFEKHIFSATKFIAETHPELMYKLPEALHYISDPN